MDLWSRTPAPKKRSARACDICRRKKVRCDGSDKPDGRCTGCINHKVECTYDEKKPFYADDAADRTAELHRKPTFTHANIPSGSAPNSPFNDGSSTRSPTLYTQTAHSPLTADEEVDQSGIPELSEDVAKMRISEKQLVPMIPYFLKHYHGRASSISYSALATILSQSGGSQKTTAEATANRLKSTRPRFWSDTETIRPEVTASMPHPSKANFPSKTYMRRRYSPFFDNGNLFSTILDRRDFDRRFEAEEYLTSDPFAGLLLTVLAICSKLTQDTESRPSYALDDKYSSGDRFSDMVQTYYRSFPGTATLLELQGICLFGFYQFISSRSHLAWVTVGIAMRHAQDVAAHRKRSGMLTRDAEFWKRTCWIIYVCDVLLSMVLGRSPMGTMDDIDVDLPAPLDDDMPILVTYITSLIGVCRNVSGILFALYTSTRPKYLAKLLGNNYEQFIVAELDSNLNEWFESIPDQLKWNHPGLWPGLKGIELSAQLYCIGYNARQLIHRPFIPRPGKESTLSFPSLAICTNAARSCANVLNVVRQEGVWLAPGATFSAMASAITLLISMWSAQHGGVRVDSAVQIADIDKCLRYLLFSEQLFLLSGRVGDVVRELASFGGIELSAQADTPPAAAAAAAAAAWKRSHSDIDEIEIPARRSGPYSPSERDARSRLTQQPSPPSQSQAVSSPISTSDLPDSFTVPTITSSYNVSTNGIGVNYQPMPMAGGSGWNTSAMGPIHTTSISSSYSGSSGAGYPVPPQPGQSEDSMNGATVAFGDPSLWMASGGPNMTGVGIGMDGLGVNDEVLGLWSYAPETFDWQQLGSIIDTFKQAEPDSQFRPTSQNPYVVSSR